MTKEDIVKFWMDDACEDFKTAQQLIKLRRFHHALFFCNLSLEKLLKGLIYKQTNTHPFPIHRLLDLSQQAKLSLTKTQKENLIEITSWNIKARYDSYKREFYKKATKEFTLN